MNVKLLLDDFSGLLTKFMHGLSVPEVIALLAIAAINIWLLSELCLFQVPRRFVGTYQIVESICTRTNKVQLGKNAFRKFTGIQFKGPQFIKGLRYIFDGPRIIREAYHKV